MSEGPWIVDKSALLRLGSSLDAELWLHRINRGLVQISLPTLLEIGYSARSGQEWEADLTGPPVSLMPLVNATPASERRALEVQNQLARRSQHRGPTVPDLLIAALAETHGSIVLHLDKDFELIADITGQPYERIRV